MQATFIPLRGKLALFQALFVDTDFYLFGGVAFAGIEERADVDERTGETAAQARAHDDTRAACDASTAQSRARLAHGDRADLRRGSLACTSPTILALTLEYRAFPFKWNTSGTDEGGLNKNREADNSGEFPDGQINEADRIFQFNQMFKLGLAFYLPFQGEITE